MSDPAEVKLDVALHVLKHYGVNISESFAEPNHPEAKKFILVKGDRVEVQFFKDRVNRKMLQYLQHHYGVPIHLFFHPEMISAERAPSASPFPPEKLQ